MRSCKDFLMHRGPGPYPSSGERKSLDEGRISLGIPALDRVLQGGLPLGCIHELVPAGVFHKGAVSGFAFALAGLVQKPGDILWAQQDFAGSEGGAPYGLGTEYFGPSPARLLISRGQRSIDVLWAMEEGLRCSGIAALIGEFADDRSLDLTATRRLSLAAQKTGALALILRPHAQPSAAATRWEIAAAPSLPDGFGGLGRARFHLRLTKNRYGPLGEWTLEWNDHEKRFHAAPRPGALALPAFDRSDRARQAG
jgi:protein ImuA